MDGKQTKVLLVEDDAGLNRLIGKNLQRAGFQIDSALKGSEALEKIHSDPNVIMLLDYQLPDMTGNQVIESLIEAQLHVPFVMMTGQGDERVAVEMMKLGARDYVIKDGDFIDGITQIIERVAKQAATERKLAETEAQLQESQIKLAGIVSSITDGMIMVNEEFDIVWANEVAENSFGSELMGKKCYTAYHDRDCVCDPCWVAETFIDGQVRNHETEAIVSDGTCKTFWSTTNVAARHPNGKPKMVVKITRDITDRKLAEKEIKEKAEELARSNADLEQFAYVASHDLREPLRMIGGYVELLEMKYKGKLDEDADKYIDHALGGTKRLSDLIDALLSYSRVRTSPGEFDLVDCETVLQEAITNLTYVIQESDAVITNDRLPTIIGDHSQLIQLFQNIIANAIKFRGKETPRIHISAELNEHHWVLSISDNGIGFNQEYGERIFAMFKMLNKKEYPGTGIGLAMCRKIVEHHGGRIWVESAIDQGSTFYFTFPALEETQ